MKAQIHGMILHAAERQIATAAIAKPLIGAGLEQGLRDLVQQIATGAAGPIADARDAGAMAVHDMIVDAAQHQIATSPLARIIIGANLEHELRNLVQQIAANAANPIANALKDQSGEDHQEAAGAACHQGPDGCCTTCGIEMTTCNVCRGVGYHRAACPQNTP
jgi:hypothetical protein